MATVSLKAATREDLQTIWEMQIKAFSDLLDKYQDYDMSPGAEGLEKIIARYEQPWLSSLVLGHDTARSRESSFVRKDGLSSDRKNG